MVGKTQPRTFADNERFEILAETGCLPCLIDGWWGQTTIQHVTSGGRREGHQRTYPACSWHHLGLPHQSFQGSLKDAQARFGPSFAHTKWDYIHRYGTEDQLIQVADAVVRIVLSARRHHEYLSENHMGRLVQALHREIVKNDPPSNRVHSDFSEDRYGPRLNHSL